MFNTEGHDYSISVIVEHECSMHVLNSWDMNIQSCDTEGHDYSISQIVGHECSMHVLNS